MPISKQEFIKNTEGIDRLVVMMDRSTKKYGKISVYKDHFDYIATKLEATPNGSSHEGYSRQSGNIVYKGYRLEAVR